MRTALTVASTPPRAASYPQGFKKGLKNKALRELEKAVSYHFGNKGRVFPWRMTRDPYAILVSEIMLQQTQVERVIPKYEAFIKQYPSWEALAKAPLADVLTLWVGLGYNRRARALHEAARVVMQQFNGKLPKDPEAIRSLPGVGPYTAGAVAAFAFDIPVAIIETNIRTVFMHHCFPRKKVVRDSDLLPLIAASLQGKSARLWYAALMDYGSHLKRQGVRLNAKSAHYAKQKKFAGSSRQLRGAIVRLTLTESLSLEGIAKRLGRALADVEREALRLQREGILSGSR